MVLASLLSSSKYIIVNKDLIKILGLHEAIILGELCSEYTYWFNKGQLKDNEYFYSTRENIQNNTGITPHFQRIALKNLEEKEIINTKKMGIPCKIFYKINEEKVIEYLKEVQIMPKNSDVNEMNDRTSTRETSRQKPHQQQEDNSVNTNNNNINNKKNNNKEHTHASNEDEQKIEYAKLVTMTKTEYNDLINTYGEETTNQLIEQLSLYKRSKGKIYDNDYAAILYWVTDRMREIEKKDANYKVFKNSNIKKSNFNQRKYPSGFFDSLYCNKCHTIK